jgi:thiamine-phosphate pyrophosphorylase
MSVPPRRALRGLYAITPEMTDTRVLLARAEACLAGGAAALQYRAKSLDPVLAREQARALAAACRRHGVPFIVNDSIELARATGADGLHLGRDDGDPRAARLALPHAILGVSCYAQPQRARAAVEAGADYVAIGSVFASSTKPGAVRAPLQALAEAKRIGQRPVVAIGGITPANAALAIAAGADMVAVISALFDAPDVAAAARAFTQLFDAQTTGAHDVRP